MAAGMGNPSADNAREVGLSPFSAEHCAYCGGTLNPRYYFCPACATPYQSEEAVITPSRPLPLTESMLIARKAPSAWPMFWAFLLVLMGSAIIAHLLFPDRDDLMLLTQSAAVLILTTVYAVRHWPSLAVQLRRLGLFQPPGLLALALLAPMLLINFSYSSFLQRLVGVQKDTIAEMFRRSGLSFGGIVLVVCVFPAICEEIAFRGLLQHWLQTAIKPVRAVILASALFAAMHFSIAGAPYLFGMGFLLGWAKWKTGSLYPSMLIHFLHNLAVVMFMWKVN
jgi:membrane protease YdiL (CAAX protease family)